VSSTGGFLLLNGYCFQLIIIIFILSLKTCQEVYVGNYVETETKSFQQAVMTENTAGRISGKFESLRDFFSTGVFSWNRGNHFGYNPF